MGTEKLNITGADLYRALYPQSCTAWDFLPDDSRETWENAAEYLALNLYQKATDNTAIYPEAGTASPLAKNYALIGLSDEALEFSQALLQCCSAIVSAHKKDLRGDKRIDPANLTKELGDLLYYAARIAVEFDLKLSDVLSRNIAKLSDRKARNVLRGSGDNR